MTETISLTTFPAFVENSFGCSIFLELAKLQQPLPADLKTLTRAECDKLATYTFHKRRNEWFTGRMVAKKCFQQRAQINDHHTPHLKNVEICNRPDGRPYIVADTDTLSDPMDISISHSREYAIAMLTDYPCGIDIQRIEKTLLRVEERFCTDDERDILKQNQIQIPTTALLAQLWAAKEASQKTLSITGTLPGFLELSLTAITTAKEYCLFTLQHRNDGEPVELVVAVGLFADYAIACHVSKRLSTKNLEHNNARITRS